MPYDAVSGDERISALIADTSDDGSPIVLSSRLSPMEMLLLLEIRGYLVCLCHSDSDKLDTVSVANTPDTSTE